jgi:hypothetical protein
LRTQSADQKKSTSAKNILQLVFKHAVWAPVSGKGVQKIGLGSYVVAQLR